MVDTAVIMAAGMGIRFSSVTAAMPKGCYPIGGKALVQRSIDVLKDCGIGDIVIVTGHLAHFYEEMASRNQGVRTVHNPHYAATGSMLSLYSAKEAVKGKDILVLESDIIYEKRAVSLLLANPQGSAMMLSDNQHSDDDYFFELNGGLLGKLFHQPTGEVSAYGELMGVCKMSAPYYESLCLSYEKMNNPKIGYEYVIEACPGMGYELVEGLIWSEMDSEAHLRRIEKDIYPKLI